VTAARFRRSGSGFWQINRETNAMFVGLLCFSDNKSKAGQFMEGHKEWIKRGFDEGLFLLAGYSPIRAVGLSRTPRRCQTCRAG
jgi:hypothetical protein